MKNCYQMLPDKDIYVIVQSKYNNGAANVAANHISELIAHTL